VPWNWIDATGPLAASLEAAAKTADVIVVNRQLDSSALPDMRSVASQVVIGSGKAVVAVPEDARGFAAAGVAMVAWDGSEEAMKALQAAVPLLRLANTVNLVEINDGSVEASAEEAAAYLSRHAIRPVVIRPPADLLPVGETILAEAQRECADYIVMGGFGHSRMVEALFGGVTRLILSESPIPVLLAH
jgi:nucleotide-binding universal stress UspA family protein